jgi:hypothetical protein
MLDENQMARETVTLVLDKGAAALANTVALEEARLGWIAALPWNQAPAELRSRPVEELPVCSRAQPGVRAASEKILVHGGEYLCVVKYSAAFASEQLHSITTSLSRVLPALRRLARDLNKPKARWKQAQIVRKIERWLSTPFLRELIRYQLEEQADGWHLQFDFDSAALPQLLNHRDRARLPRLEGWRLAELGSHASLDGSQDSHSRLLLHARHFFAAPCPQAGASHVG